MVAGKIWGWSLRNLVRSFEDAICVIPSMSLIFTNILPESVHMDRVEKSPGIFVMHSLSSWLRLVVRNFVITMPFPLRSFFCF